MTGVRLMLILKTYLQPSVDGTTFETLIFAMLFTVKPTLTSGIYELAVLCYRLTVFHRLL